MVKLVDTLRNFWQPLGQFVRIGRRGDDERDIHGHWSRKIDSHAYGQFSCAVVQANSTMEDYCQVEVGKDATFVGVYDGHGGHHAAWYIDEGLFNTIIYLAQENGGVISEQLLRNAFSEIENRFTSMAEGSRNTMPNIHKTGSCCLIGLICNKKLYVGNLGDSRAVLGRVNRRKLDQIIAEQLTPDHNVNLVGVRRAVQVEHQDHDPNVVVKDDHGVWRIKGIIQISRSIGDLYLKSEEFANIPIPRPFLRSDPFLETRNIEPTDKFVIFASDGLWENLTNEKAVNIVAKNPRYGIAKRLLKKAMKEAGKKKKLSYDKVRDLPVASRRPVHDDISVVVLYIDHDLLESGGRQVLEVSVKAGCSSTVESRFAYILGDPSTSGYGGGDGASTSGYGGARTSDSDGASTSGYGGVSTLGVDGASTSGSGGASPSAGDGASTSEV